MEDIEQFLLNYCGINSSRKQKYLEHYERNKNKIVFSLLNLGTYLPHLTDVRWKMDYIVKVWYHFSNGNKLNNLNIKFIYFLQSSMMEDSEGPIFRISLSAEKFDDFNNKNTIKNIIFSCTSQELQDLLYKFKDALRHCNTICNRINL